MLRTLESNSNWNTAVFTRGTRKHRVWIEHDNMSVPKNQSYREYMFSEGTRQCFSRFRDGLVNPGPTAMSM